MKRAIADERGVSLIELLVVIVLSGIVMGTTLTTFAQFEQTTASNQRQNDAQDQVRVGLAGVVREMRNLASPTNELPEAVVRQDTDDLVFQSVSSSITRRVRYCLNMTQQRLWRQVQVEPFSDPSATCPDNGWGPARVVAEHITNGTTRPVFSYNSTDPLAVTEVGTSLWVDITPANGSHDEATLQSSVFLRNQNRAPVAIFADPVVNSGSILLNGSQSSDPEGKTLEFFWYDEDVTTNQCSPKPPDDLPQTGCVALGVVTSYSPPPGTYDLYLIVRDPATLIGTSAVKSACVPGNGVTC